ncbi:MAG TPA: hypothetical protein VFE42_02065 [Chloroflexota bacterium]|nr:hypothetical protein [Chloroflexota bacterium]
MKLLLEIIIAIFLHPIAVVLAWLNILSRDDLGFLSKLIWAIVSVLWGIGPILYILIGGGQLW